jgi:hypothetical protein
MNIQVNPYRILKVLTLMVLLLVIAHLCTAFIWDYIPSFPRARLFYRLFNLNQEYNIPTFFSSLNLLASSVLLFMIGYFVKSLGMSHKPWWGLSAVFCFLAIDESVSIHESFNGFARNNLGVGGLLYFGWVIPYGLGLLALLYVYIPFLKALSKENRILFVISGFLFVLGAVGFEMLGGRQKDIYGGGILYHIFYTIEETLEMIGISLFNFTLVKYLSQEVHHLTFSFLTMEGREELDIEAIIPSKK